MAALLVAQRRAPGIDPEITRPMPRGLAVALVLQAAVLTAVGLCLVIVPTRVLDRWPWTLTPLTSRAIGAWCVALGFAAGLAVREKDLSRLRAASVTYVVFGLLQAGAVLRYRDDVAWDEAAAWLYVAALVAITASGAYGWQRSRSHTATRVRADRQAG
jgi:hypothetical protein